MDFPNFVDFFKISTQWDTISSIIIPPIWIQLSIIVTVFGYVILYLLTRTKYGVDEKLLDIKLERSQDYLIAPILISIPLILSSFIQTFFLTYLSVMIMSVSQNVQLTGLTLAATFYFYLTVFLFSESRRLIRITKLNNKILNNVYNSLFIRILFSLALIGFIFIFSILVFLYENIFNANPMVIDIKILLQIIIALILILVIAILLNKLRKFILTKEFDFDKLDFAERKN